MGTRMQLILAAPPEDVTAAQAHGLTLAHMAYRVGGGPHLFRSNQPIPARGGLMYIDDGGFDGRGTPDAFCQEVVRECAARGFGGVVCAFDRKLPLLSAVVEQLGPMLVRQGRSFYVSEPYGRCTATGRVLIPTALSGGSLRQRLGEAAERYGAGRVALAVERTAADFFLPSPDGQGRSLTREELKARLEERSPSVFFSDELCARYFTYMNRQSGAHFVLFDDAGSIRKKLRLAEALGIDRALLCWPEVSDLMGDILT